MNRPDPVLQALFDRLTRAHSADESPAPIYLDAREFKQWCNRHELRPGAAERAFAHLRDAQVSLNRVLSELSPRKQP